MEHARLTHIGAAKDREASLGKPRHGRCSGESDAPGERGDAGREREASDFKALLDEDGHAPERCDALGWRAASCHGRIGRIGLFERIFEAVCGQRVERLIGTQELLHAQLRQRSRRELASPNFGTQHRRGLEGWDVRHEVLRPQCHLAVLRRRVLGLGLAVNNDVPEAFFRVASDHASPLAVAVAVLRETTHGAIVAQRYHPELVWRIRGLRLCGCGPARSVPELKKDQRQNEWTEEN